MPTIPISDLAGGVAAAFAIAPPASARSGTAGASGSTCRSPTCWPLGRPGGRVRMVGLDAPLSGAPGYGTFPTADDRHVALGIMNEDHFWVGLCRALDLRGPRAAHEHRAEPGGSTS